MANSTPLSQLKVIDARGGVHRLEGWPAELVGLILIYKESVNAVVFNGCKYILRKAERIAAAKAGRLEIHYGPSRLEFHHTESERVDLSEKE